MAAANTKAPQGAPPRQVKVRTRINLKCRIGDRDYEFRADKTQEVPENVVQVLREGKFLLAASDEL